VGDNTLVELGHVTKTFGSVVALEDVTLEVDKGRIHGLLGENGAGKSTLMNVLYGLYTPDQGEIRIDGQEVVIRSPYDSIRRGIGMVHQVSTLVGEFTAVENILLGTKTRRFSRSSEGERGKILRLSEEYGLAFPLDTKAKELSAGIKQKIEIVRSLYRDAKLLILDEPTTSLVASEFQQLLLSLQALVEKGLTVIFITHKIKEVMEACHSVTVLRKGRVQGLLSRDQMSKESLVKLMFMEKDIRVTESALPNVDLPPMERSGSPVLEARHLLVCGSDGNPALDDVSFELYGGEILGIVAVSGNGEKELAQAICNPAQLEGGDILVEGKSIRNLSTPQVFARGVAYTPEDRIQEGILPEASITENILLGHQGEARFLKHRLFINWNEARITARATIKEYNIHTPDERIALRQLSGGNIQKAVIGRAYVSPVKVLVTHNPTSGLDIATVEAIFQKLVQSRNQGGAVLWINEDLDELMIISDRIAVLHRGALKAIFERRDFDKYKIGLMMIGG
jgi:general nucleoside transport system ATP-binding protein